jgi:hypothetical protein
VPDAADRRIAVRLACVVAVGLAILHRGHFLSSDERGLYFQTRALAQDFSLAVPPLPMALPGADGRLYSHYTVGQSIAAMPLYWLGELVASVLPDRARRALEGPATRPTRGPGTPVGPEAFAVLLYPPVATGVLAALFFAAERRLGASRRAAVLAGLALVSTTHVGTLATLFLQHTTEAICALGAFHFWHRFRASGAARDLLFGSALANAILAVRIGGAISGLALGGYLLFALWEWGRAPRSAAEWRSAALAVAAPVVGFVMCYALVNHAKWGLWIDSPMVAERGKFGADPRRALVGFLASPGMSVFVYSPLLLLLPVTFPRFWRAHRPEAAAVLGLSLSTLLFYSSYSYWTGLFAAPGPRYLFVPLVFSMLPLGPWLDAVRGVGWRAITAALAAAGAVVQLLSTVPSWSRLTFAEGYQQQEPQFDFVFHLASSPLVAAARTAFAPDPVDLWIARTARGWPGQPGAPAAALLVAFAWAIALLWLAARLRRALAEAEPANP